MGALLVNFLGGDRGPWRVERVDTIIGDGLEPVPFVEVVEGWAAPVPASTWSLRGVVSNDRYLQADEKARLAATQEGLGRAAATRAALIPIRKNEAWWTLTQAERRDILETTSRHIAIGLDYLPAIARRLHHGRDLNEPFDFVTWFEFAPEEEPAFDELVSRLRATEEWSYVDREVDIRLALTP